MQTIQEDGIQHESINHFTNQYMKTLLCLYVFTLFIKSILFVNELVVCLHGVGQSSPHKLVHGVELGPNVISLHGITIKPIPVWTPDSRFNWALGVKGVLQWFRVP